jgi:hypothetical protein
MKLLEHLQIIPFILAFIFGLYFVLHHKPESQSRIPKFPHPSNVEKITYKDHNGLCFQYTAESVDCGTVKEKLSDYPHM